MIVVVALLGGAARSESAPYQPPTTNHQLPTTNCQQPYISIVRDHNGRVVEKSAGTFDTKISNPAFRAAVVGCLFAQLQDEGVLDPNARVSDYLPGFKTLTLREAMANSAGPRFVSDIVEPCIEKITGKKVDDLLAERFWKPLGICAQLPTTNCQQPTANCQLPTTNCQLPTTNYQLPTTNYQLPTTNYQLPTTNFYRRRH